MRVLQKNQSKGMAYSERRKYFLRKIKGNIPRNIRDHGKKNCK